MTPYKAVYGKKLDLRGVWEWGSRCWIMKRSSKISDRAEEGRWIGFDEMSKGHRIYWPTKQSVSVEWDVKFTPAPDPPLLEGEAREVNFDFGECECECDEAADKPARSTKSVNNLAIEQSGPEAVTTSDYDHQTRPTTDNPPTQSQPIQPPTLNPHQTEDPPPTSALPKRPGYLSYHDQANIIPSRLQSQKPPQDQDIQGEQEHTMAAAISYHEGMEPSSLKEAMERPDRSQWEEAMKEEIERLIRRGTWKPVPRPEGANIVGSKWVYRLKKDANRNVTSHRAHLVAQGFTQVHGVDFDDTFAPIAWMVSIRTVLALTARYDWEIHQVDVKSTYLYGELNEDEVIYMKPPPGDIKVCKDGYVLQLLKALYGLKQSRRQWYQVLRKILEGIGLVRSEHDHAVFFKHQEGTLITILLAHVDDFLIIAQTTALVKEIKDRL